LATKTKSKRIGIVDQRLVKALAHPVRVHVLDILNERVASPNQLAQELGEGLSQVSYHVKVLRDYECIELVKTEPRRGAVEHFYRATTRPLLTDSDFEQLPASIRTGLSATFLKRVVDDAWGALNAGTLDARDERHTSWTPMIVDEQGWTDLSRALADTLERVFDIQAESAGRLAEAGVEGMSVSVTMMSFETPPADPSADGSGLKP
jgi:DNA-binding transcriptional ArsR family regulator